MLTNNSGMAFAIGVQLEPFQWTSGLAGSTPNAQTSSGPLPHTPKRSAVVPLALCDHAEPSKWTMAPPSPTAQTSRGPLPHTRCRFFVVGLALDAHAEPSKWAM